MATRAPAKPSAARAPAKTQVAAAKSFAKALTKLPDNWIMCRDVRHAWAVEADFHVEPGQHVGRKILSVRRVLLCMRCPTRRVEHYIAGRYGLDKVSQSYIYPDSYQMPGIPRGVRPSSIIQQETYRRAMEKAAESAPGETARTDR